MTYGRNVLSVSSVALAVLTLVFAFSGCGEEKSSDSKTGDNAAASEPSDAERRRVTELGQEASEALMQSLGGQLKAAMQSGGPVQAISVCRQAALPLTAAAGESFDGVAVRRTTLKTRNPANAPDATDREVLESMASAAAQNAAPPDPVIEWQDDVARFYRPLMMQEICLKCHGDPASFSPELTQALADSYPDDQATGYALGELRGVIRVDVDIAKP
ncbi:MAG: DUF3365 domain-containing protein [Verrucomicrobiae bacterium]|nr:DUF3365 domain-containing protein [Verrucomicrobiae bacterium]